MKREGWGGGKDGRAGYGLQCGGLREGAALQGVWCACMCVHSYKELALWRGGRLGRRRCSAVSDACKPDVSISIPKSDTPA